MVIVTSIVVIVAVVLYIRYQLVKTNKNYFYEVKDGIETVKLSGEDSE